MLLAQLGIKNLEKVVHDKKEEIDQPFRGYFVTFFVPGLSWPESVWLSRPGIQFTVLADEIPTGRNFQQNFHAFKKCLF